jgi:WD40 repeat protein
VHSDGTVRLWRAATGECTATLAAHRSRIWDIAADRAGRLLASASGDASIRVRGRRLPRARCAAS